MNGKEIKENISEKQKSKRGRPRLLVGWKKELVKDCGIHTERGRQNTFYQARATGLLQNDPRFSWLANGKAAWNTENPDYNPYKVGILQELGRIQDDNELREVALFLCDKKPSTREAISIIRRIRLDERRSRTGNAQRLAEEIVHKLDDYLIRYPDTSNQTAEEALNIVLKIVKPHRKVSG
jgi:hypothetical protein